MLTETPVRRRTVFVDDKAHDSAGGTMLHDLFQGDDSGWLEDPALLDHLFSEKLQADSEAIATDGWKWIEVSLDFPYGYSHGLRRLNGDPAPMTKLWPMLSFLPTTGLARRNTRHRTEEIDARLGDLEVTMEKLDARPRIFDAEEITRAGAFVTLDRYGELAVYRGFVGSEDEPREDVDVHSGEQTEDGQGAEPSAGCCMGGFGHGTIIISAAQALGANVPDDEDDCALNPLPERLVMELVAHRTLALREAVERSPDVALTLLLVGDIFRSSNSAGSCLEAPVRHVYISAQASDLKDSVVAKLVDDCDAEWEADLPLGDDAVHWDYLTSLDQGSRRPIPT